MHKNSTLKVGYDEKALTRPASPVLISRSTQTGKLDGRLIILIQPHLHFFRDLMAVLEIAIVSYT